MLMQIHGNFEVGVVKNWFGHWSQDSKIGFISKNQWNKLIFGMLIQILGN